MYTSATRMSKRYRRHSWRSNACKVQHSFNYCPLVFFNFFACVYCFAALFTFAPPTLIFPNRKSVYNLARHVADPPQFADDAGRNCESRQVFTPQTSAEHLPRCGFVFRMSDGGNVILRAERTRRRIALEAAARQPPERLPHQGQGSDLLAPSESRPYLRRVSSCVYGCLDSFVYRAIPRRQFFASSRGVHHRSF